jgi:hypothetical protein
MLIAANRIPTIRQNKKTFKKQCIAKIPDHLRRGFIFFGLLGAHIRNIIPTTKYAPGGTNTAAIVQQTITPAEH